MGYFWGRGRAQKLFWGLLTYTDNFCFLSFALFLLYNVVLSLCGWCGVPSDYFDSTQYSYSCFVVRVEVCCWAMTIKKWKKQAWLQAYKVPCIVESGSYAFTTVCGPEYMNFKMYILFLQECKNKPCKQVFLAKSNAAFLTFFQEFSKK